MEVDGFDWPRMYKFEDNLWNYAVQWVEEYVLEYYDVETIGDLTEDQIDDVKSFMETNVEESSPLITGFYELINWWEETKNGE